jgi:hypothetical protein
MRRALPMMFAELNWGLAPTVFATDAAGGDDGPDSRGTFGIVARHFADRAYVNHIYERARFISRTVVSLDGDPRALKYPEKPCEATRPFTNIHDSVFDPAGWFPILSGSWRVADHITLGEMRTVVKLLDVLLLAGSFFKTKVLSMQDNMCVAGSGRKGRSPSTPVNYLLRRKTARTIAGAIRILLPWTESAKQPADSLSRLPTGGRGGVPRSP